MVQQLKGKGEGEGGGFESTTTKSHKEEGGSNLTGSDREFRKGGRWS